MEKMDPFKTSFAQFMGKFPEVALPVTLTDESHHIFSQENDPLTAPMIARFIQPLEEPPDEFTEYIACFRLPKTEGFYALVYWRAGLLTYHYNLITFTSKGEPIDRRVIAGTFSDGKTLTQSMATIDEDWEIVVVSGQAAAEEGQLYDASTSAIYKLELLPDGKIVNL